VVLGHQQGPAPLHEILDGDVLVHLAFDWDLLFSRVYRKLTLSQCN